MFIKEMHKEAVIRRFLNMGEIEFKIEKKIICIDDLIKLGCDISRPVEFDGKAKIYLSPAHQYLTEEKTKGLYLIMINRIE
jgi:hypothetical protein